MSSLPPPHGGKGGEGGGVGPHDPPTPTPLSMLVHRICTATSTPPIHPPTTATAVTHNMSPRITAYRDRSWYCTQGASVPEETEETEEAEEEAGTESRFQPQPEPSSRPSAQSPPPQGRHG